MNSRPKAISLTDGHDLSGEDQEIAALAVQALRDRVTDIIANLGVAPASDALLTVTAQVLITEAGEEKAAAVLHRAADSIPRMQAAMRRARSSA
jgi:hypothetical protein